MVNFKELSLLKSNGYIHISVLFEKTVLKDTANSVTSFKYRLIENKPLLVVGDRKICLVI